MSDVCQRGLVSLAFVLVVGACTHAPLHQSPKASSLATVTEDLDSRALSPFAVFDWVQTGATSSRLEVVLGWSGAPDAELEYAVWTSRDSRFETKPTLVGVTWTEYRSQSPWSRDFPGLADGSIAHTLVAIRDRSQTVPEIHFAEFSGVHKKASSSCRVAYHRFREEDLATSEFDQPQIGGSIGFKKVKGLTGSRIEVELDPANSVANDRLHVTFKDTGSATAQQAYVWVSSRPTWPWDFRAFGDASVRGGRRLNGSVKVQVDADHHYSGEVDATSNASELYLYIVVSESDANGRLVYWHYWTKAPLDIGDLHVGNASLNKVVRVDLDPTMFDRAVSAFCASNPIK